jgi:polyisoprenoid-binding protein YceI
LDAEAYPEISARIDSIAERPGDGDLPYEVTMVLEVHGRTVETTLRARHELEGDLLRVEAVGAFRFTDFGIEPYSAMLGMVKNKNEFHVLIAFVAVPSASDTNQSSKGFHLPRVTILR